MNKRVLTQEEFAFRQLDRLYARLDRDKDRSLSIRNWCVTVWLAAMTLVAYNKSGLSGPATFLIPLAPVILFWILDAGQHVFILPIQERLRDLEDHLIRYDSDGCLDVDLLSISDYFSRLSKRKRITAMLRSLFGLETVIGFYLLLILATLAMLWVILDDMPPQVFPLAKIPEDWIELVEAV